MQIDHVTVDSLGSSKHELSRTDQPLTPPHFNPLSPWAQPYPYRATAPSPPAPFTPQQAARFDLAVISCLSRKERTQKQHRCYRILLPNPTSVKIISTLRCALFWDTTQRREAILY